MTSDEPICTTAGGVSASTSAPPAPKEVSIPTPDFCLLSPHSLFWSQAIAYGAVILWLIL